MFFTNKLSRCVIISTMASWGYQSSKLTQYIVQPQQTVRLPQSVSSQYIIKTENGIRCGTLYLPVCGSRIQKVLIESRHLGIQVDINSYKLRNIVMFKLHV